MIITFLGTGTSQGVPVIACNCEVCKSIDFRDKRLRTSVHINTQDTSIIIDTGPDFRQQVLRERIGKLDAVLYTHAHKDHTAGMDDIRGFNFKQKRDMPIYGRLAVLDQIKKEFAYVFSDHKYPGIPAITPNVIENRPFKINRVVITPIEVLHYKLTVFGFRVGDFTYITDAKYIDEEEKEKIKGSKVLVLNALQIKPHISHFNLEEAVAMVEQLKPDKAYFVHISHKLGLHKTIIESLPPHIELAYDGLRLEM
ncbi:MAG: MBL fold metallo-hydrolase [Bacteroidetes bacterium]|nr:MBL fold metallo-hydrolase [Bacteroidota bacterium]